MLEDQFYRSKLISGYLRGELSESEEQELNAWIAVSPENSNYLLREFGSEEQVRHLLSQYNSLDENALWDKINNKLQVPEEQMYVPGKPDEMTIDLDKNFVGSAKDLVGSDKGFGDPDKDAHGSDKNSKEWAEEVSGNKIYSLSYKLAAAAALFIIGTLSFILFHFAGTHSHSTYSTNIRAGRSGATLTLADGRKIRLSDTGAGQLAEESGVRITKNAGGQIVYTVLEDHITSALPAKNSRLEQRLHTLSTSNGEQYQVILPDQTKVWLNAASSITYPASFTGLDCRKVEITGEVYFEVAKVYATSSAMSSAISSAMSSAISSAGSSKKGTAGQSQRVPFIVATNRQQVEVLGTHFNINAYADEPVTKTALLEGSITVRVLSNNTDSYTKNNIGNNKNSSTDTKNNIRNTKNGADVLLIPGQQSILRGQILKVAPADTENTVDWKNGDFVFKGEDFKTTMRKIARWYNVEMIYDPSLPADIELAGWISRESRLSLVLERIELAGKIHFKVQGRRITIMK